jgi:hypothetical protein
MARFDCRMAAPAVVADPTVYPQEASRRTSPMSSGPVATKSRIEKSPTGRPLKSRRDFTSQSHEPVQSQASWPGILIRDSWGRKLRVLRRLTHSGPRFTATSNARLINAPVGQVLLRYQAPGQKYPAHPALLRGPSLRSFRTAFCVVPGSRRR